MVDREGGVRRAAGMRTAAVWRKSREIGGLLSDRGIPLKNRASIHEACIISVLNLWHGDLTNDTEGGKLHPDLWQTDVEIHGRCIPPGRSAQRRCGVGQVVDVVRSRRLRWFGHVEMREEEDPLAVIREWEMEGRRPCVKPRKTWQKTNNS